MKYLIFSASFIVFAIFFAISAFEFRGDAVAMILFALMTVFSLLATLLGYFCYLDEHDK